jgi:hypothetical protein
MPMASQDFLVFSSQYRNRTVRKAKSQTCNAWLKCLLSLFLPARNLGGFILDSKADRASLALKCWPKFSGPQSYSFLLALQTLLRRLPSARTGRLLPD